MTRLFPTMIPALWSYIVLFILCLSSQANAGGEMGNGGDYLHFRFKWAQQRIERILTALNPSLLPPATPAAVSEFLLTKKDILRVDVVSSSHDWQSAPIHPCAVTQPTPQAPISLSYEGCGLEATNIEVALTLLVKMSLSHLGVSDNDFRSQSVDALLGAWQKMGGDEEHWENLTTVTGQENIVTWNKQTFWTGSHVIVPYFSGSGARNFLTFNPVDRSFASLPILPDRRQGDTANLAGRLNNKLVVLFGKISNDSHQNDGWVLDLRSKNWQPVSKIGAPTPRSDAQTTVLNDGRIFVWGGYNGFDLLDGVIYNPDSDSWEPIPVFPRVVKPYLASIVATDTQVIVQASDHKPNSQYGAAYDLVQHIWRPISQQGVPDGPIALGLWTGEYAVTWGRNCLYKDSERDRRSCGMYHSQTDSWRSIPTESLRSVSDPDALSLGWSGHSLIYWTKQPTTSDPDPHGAIFYPETNNWEAITNDNAPRSARNAGVWIEDGLLVISEHGFGDNQKVSIDLYHPRKS